MLTGLKVRLLHLIYTFNSSRSSSDLNKMLIRDTDDETLKKGDPKY
jgi:hypothetical protein